MNQYESVKGKDLELEKLTPAMRMQAELALRFYGINKEGLTRKELSPYILKWVEHNDCELSKAFRLALTECPKLLAEYETDPESALDKIENLIKEHVDVRS